MSKFFISLAILSSVVLAGCGKGNESSLPYSLIGFWKYTGTTFPDGREKMPDMKEANIIEYTPTETRLLAFFTKGFTNEPGFQWNANHSYSIQGDKKIEWETKYPSNQRTYTVRFVDANQVELVCLETARVPAGTIFHFKRITSERSKPLSMQTCKNPYHPNSQFLGGAVGAASLCEERCPNGLPQVFIRPQSLAREVAWGCVSPKVNRS